MKRIKIPTTRALSLLMAMLMLLGLCLTACQGGGDDTTAEQTTPSPDVTSTPPSESTVGGEDTTKAPDTAKMPYTVELTSAGGLKIKDATVLIYSDASLTVMNGYAKTDENGVASFSLPAEGTSYHAVISEISEGYDLADGYPLTGSDTKITLTSAVIADTSLAGVQYKLGDIMHDFTATTIDGETFTLSEALKTKKAVLINFWYINCSWCEKEFPYMDSVYREYSDDIAIIALNPYATDSESAIKTYISAMNLSIPMAKVDHSLADAFNVEYYPTSIMVDRYGMISVFEQGAIVSEAPFRAGFDHFKSDNYTQRLEESLQAFVVIPKPDTDMPDPTEVAKEMSPAFPQISYRAETDEQYKDTIWDFDIVEKNGAKALVNTNQEVHGSTSLLYVDVELKAGQAVKFDYWSSSEQGADLLHVIIDDVQIYNISGDSQGWQTCYPYVAIKDGKYTLAVAYIKDANETVGEDSVYLKNFGICDASAIDTPSYIPRNCATERSADGYGYEKYVDVVFNENDGYYHVGSANGPLLLANLMGYNTAFAQDSVYNMAYNGAVVIDGVNYYDRIVRFCSYASNASISGVCTVNKELKELLEKVAFACGIEVENEKQWLQMCVYYDVYGGAEQLEDPIKGLSPHSAYTAKLGNDNVVTYDRMIMPRGLHYKFVPEKSGAYRITSDSEELVEAWIFDEEGILETDDSSDAYYIDEGGERLFMMKNDLTNCSMVVYFEAGKSYYIDIVFYDIYYTGSIKFSIEYIAETYQHFTLASPGYFTFLQEDNGTVINETVAGGIDVILAEDGYYHELREDGTIGSILYADFVMTTPVFSSTLTEMISQNGYNFKYTEYDLYILYYYILYGDQMYDQLKAEWGEAYDEYYEIYKVDDVVKGITHGGGEDYTEEMKKYAEMAVDTPETPERSGCVPVDARLAEILQALMDKYTFEDVDHSWTKVCYYYKYIGAPQNP